MKMNITTLAKIIATASLLTGLTAYAGGARNVVSANCKADLELKNYLTQLEAALQSAVKHPEQLGPLCASIATRSEPLAESVWMKYMYTFTGLDAQIKRLDRKSNRITDHYETVSHFTWLSDSILNKAVWIDLEGEAVRNIRGGICELEIGLQGACDEYDRRGSTEELKRLMTPHDLRERHLENGGASYSYSFSSNTIFDVLTWYEDYALNRESCSPMIAEEGGAHTGHTVETLN